MKSSVRQAIIFALIAGVLTMGQVCAKDFTAAVLKTGFPGEDGVLIQNMAEDLQSSGYKVMEFTPEQLCDATALDARKVDLLLLPDSSALPAKAAQSVEAYLKGGGDILALNTPMWQRSLLNIANRWLTHEEYQTNNAAAPLEHTIITFDGNLDGWRRNSNEADVKTTAQSGVDGPAPNQKALHVTIPNMTSWDTFGIPKLDKPFADRQTLTVFSAKGGPDTTQLAIEWTEKDGSRWMVVVALTPEWRRYVLQPNDFQYWQSNPARGGRDDHLNPENAESFTVGLAFTHTTGIPSGKHEYWVGPVGTATMNPEYQELFSAVSPPALDTLSPGYKLFDMHGVTSLKVREDQVIVGQEDLSIPSVLRSPHPRPKGGGFDKGRDWRFIPLIEGNASNGEWRGTPATLMVHASGPYKGGVWASFGIGDLTWYKTPSARAMIRQIVQRMKVPLWMVDGGTKYYTYFDGQDLTPGVRAVNFSDERHTDARGRVGFATPGDSVQTVTQGWVMDLKPGEIASVSGSLVPSRFPDHGYDVTAELLLNNQVIDRVTHEANGWRPKEKKEFVTEKDGDFYLNGKRWRAHGVNYMPSSGIGTEAGEYFEHYLSAGSYDPEVFQRDIDHLKDLGFNAVSIFVYTGVEKDQNLLDLLRRLDLAGIKADLALRPGTPFDFEWPKIGDIIKNSRLNENDTIFAYDLAWEPSFGHQRDRVRFDADWEQWIVERYGSVKNAEADWGFPIPRDETGKITNPTPEQVDTSGKWNVMIAAYRRFLDTVLYKKYGEARRLIRTVDPNHMVSFRMSEATNPTYRWEGRITFDFPYLAAAVDILAPEAYGRIGDWEKVKPGWFQFEWARLFAPQKPFMWKEMGCSTWDNSRMTNSESRFAFQETFYRAFYKMLIANGTDGIFFWWYPGGFRYGENSDYGVINPDGTDRPVTKVIRENASLYLNGTPTKPVDKWVTVDRDAHPDGISGVYEEVKDAFWSAVDKGLTPGLRTKGSGKDSTNCPLLAVGNTPCNGKNPPKYLDAAIDLVEVKDASGKWVSVTKGGKVTVKKNQPVTARITFTNLAEAKLSSPQKQGSNKGAVYLTISASGKTKLLPLSQGLASLQSTIKNVPVSDVIKSKKAVTFSFVAKGRTAFGEKFTVTLLPQ